MLSLPTIRVFTAACFRTQRAQALTEAGVLGMSMAWKEGTASTERMEERMACLENFQDSWGMGYIVGYSYAQSKEYDLVEHLDFTSSQRNNHVISTQQTERHDP